MDENGIWHTETRSLVDITRNYFANLFSSFYPSAASIGATREGTDAVENNQMNEALCAPFSEKEVHRAVFQMHSSKTSGPDGFTAFFYQKLWPVIGNDITAGVLAILNDQQDPSDWNTTLTTLIPKVKEPMNLKDFRLISLCNTYYKIVSRTITNRFRPILNQIIDSFQSAFITGRLILDNVIVGFECMHWIRNNQQAKTGYVALKLDMSKACDIVKWIFLKEIMIKLGFADPWVSLIMRCVSTVSYSFRINHSIYGSIHTSKGLLQGDPLSSYLFVLCAQGFSHLLSKAVERKLIRGVKIANSSPVISHLFFCR